MKAFTVDGAKIARCREMAGLNHPQLAAELGVHQSAISHWEAGRYSPGPDNFKLLCTVLRVTPDQLLADEAGAA